MERGGNLARALFGGPVRREETVVVKEAFLKIQLACKSFSSLFYFITEGDHRQSFPRFGYLKRREVAHRTKDQLICIAQSY
jgi:hypothetical protein